MTAVSVRELVLEYRSARGIFRALDRVSLDVAPGEIFAIVGESGSGKSTLAMSLGRLLHRSAYVLSGEIRIDGQLLFDLPEEALRALRKNQFGFIFQDPVASLDPTMKIGRQVELAVSHKGLNQSPEEALRLMRFTDVKQVLASYPHEVSGGMAQRVAIAMTLARRPQLIVADEPTAALDASVKAEILDLLVTQCKENGVSLLLATHDLLSVRRHAERMAVMYAGRIVEEGPAPLVFDAPCHPYTRALLGASVGQERPGERLVPIPGIPPIVHSVQTNCAFAERCRHVQAGCRENRPEQVEVKGRRVICLRARDLTWQSDYT